VALNEEQVRGNLAAFASRWGDREWGERENAQTFHRTLDAEVASAYGWPRRVVGDPLEIRARLAKLHAGIISGKTPYQPFE